MTDRRSEGQDADRYDGERNETMDPIDMSEYFAGSIPSAQTTVARPRPAADAKRPRVNLTYNGFFGFPISDWVLSLLAKKTPSAR
jgi:hypothetical protein